MTRLKSNPKFLTENIINTTAYSLIELIISISILSIICFLSTPNYTNLITTLEAYQILNQLQETLNFAKYIAQLNQQEIQIEFKPDPEIRLTCLEIYNLQTKQIILHDSDLFKLKYGYIQYNHPHLKNFPIIFYPAGHTNLPGTFSYHPYSISCRLTHKQLILSRTGQSRKTF